MPSKRLFTHTHTQHVFAQLKARGPEEGNTCFFIGGERVKKKTDELRRL